MKDIFACVSLLCLFSKYSSATKVFVVVVKAVVVVVIYLAIVIAQQLKL